MRTLLLAASAVLVPFMAPAPAAMVTDATGDFLPTYVGPPLADLDVTSFSVNYNAVSRIFTLGATFAGEIVPGSLGFYVIGVNTGTGVLRPFAAVGQPDVVFNQAITIRKDGTGSVGQTVLDPASISIAGNLFTVRLSDALFPSTGFAPANYGFNLWPRIGTGNNNQITDFSPENATLAAQPLPEPATWALMLLGFGAAGVALRRRRPVVPVAA